MRRAELHWRSLPRLRPFRSYAPAPDDLTTEHPTSTETEVVQRTCVRCHNARRLNGNLSLEGFVVEEADRNADIAERMVRKLRAGMMPPPRRAKAGGGHPGRPGGAPRGGSRRGGRRTSQSGCSDLPAPQPCRIRARHQRPARPGRRRWRLAPALDQMSANFDNIADVQALSPTLVDAYLNAAAEISRWAVGDRTAPAVDHSYKVSDYTSQHPWDRAEGAPYGTRGGIVVDHVFPRRRRVRVRTRLLVGRQTPDSKTSTSRSTASGSRCSTTHAPVRAPTAGVRHRSQHRPGLPTGPVSAGSRRPSSAGSTVLTRT